MLGTQYVVSAYEHSFPSNTDWLLVSDWSHRYGRAEKNQGLGKMKPQKQERQALPKHDWLSEKLCSRSLSNHRSASAFWRFALRVLRVSRCVHWGQPKKPCEHRSQTGIKRKWGVGVAKASRWQGYLASMGTSVTAADPRKETAWKLCGSIKNRGQGRA
jgi:hypothetical protein